MSVFSEKLSALAQLARWDRLVGVWLLLAPAVCGLVLAGAGRPDVKLLVIFTIGAVLMRSAGCVANDLADRNLDGFVARTAMRPLAIGSVSVSAALVLLFILLLAAASLLYFLNLKTILLALAVLPVVLLYPFCKRFMPCPQAVLAIAFAWPVLLAFSAQGTTFTLSTWLWFAGVWAWVVAYDTAYAMADRSDDVRVGIKSSAIWFGKYDRVFVLALNLITLVCFGLAATLQNLHNAFFLGWLMMLLLFINGWRQIWQRDPEQCFAAFKQNIWIGLAWFVAVVLGFL